MELAHILNKFVVLNKSSTKIILAKAILIIIAYLMELALMAEDYSDKLAGVPLKDVLRTVRLELEDAMKEAEGRSLQFQVENVELELKVEVTSKVGGKGGIQFWVVSAEAQGERAYTTAHTFKFTLKPVANNNGNSHVMIAGESNTDVSLE